MEKFSFLRLWDIYHGLLTATQKDITDMYFNLDLTVSEIAEEKGISRQAVSECLSGCKKQLEEYEEKLGFAKMLDGAVLWAEELKSAHPELSGDADALLEILDKDYSQEVGEVLNKK